MQEEVNANRFVAERREIRVFISSTFHDMQEEREELVKQIFPQLRRQCESRGVTWGEVDLRWGVPDEARAEGKVLPLCLAEIEHCRPYFIGLLGGRYGWVPEEIPQELIEEQPWLSEHRKKSVTALEILYGVLLNPKMTEHAFFYFRDPTAHAGFTEEDTDRRERLAELKEAIRKSGFSVDENFATPKQLGEWVLRDLTAVIAERYPIEDIPNALDRDAADHEAYAASRRAVYISRKEYIERLDAHAAGDGPPLVVLGGSGVGKSALLANWTHHWREQHHETPVLVHFIGAAPDSANWMAMLRRLLGEFQRRFDIQIEIPDQPDPLRMAFANALHMVASHGRVVLVLDALNQIEDRDGAPDLVWLPPVIPANVRLVVSTLPGRPLDDLQKRGWPVLTVEPLSVPEREELIVKYLKRYAKQLSSGPAHRIAAAPQTGNGLYLSTLLNELRQFGRHEKLNELITWYLEADNPSELYRKVIQRWEKDYGQPDPACENVVRESLARLWAARRGLSETELLESLGRAGSRLPRAVWSPLFLAAGDALVNRGGLLSFAHGFLREAVQLAYLPTESQQLSAYHMLSIYFDSQSKGFRRVDELPWLLERQKEWPKLRDFLVDRESFATLLGDDHLKWELIAYWVAIGFRFDPRVEYQTAVARYAQDNPAKDKASFQHTIGEFFLLRGEDAAAVEFFEAAYKDRTAILGDEDAATLASGNRLALAQEHLGHYSEAESLYRKQLATSEALFGNDHPSTLQAVHDLGGFLSVNDHSAEAIPLLERALAGREKSLGITASATLTTRLNLGLAYFNVVDPRTEKLYLELLAVDESATGKDSATTQEVVVALAVLYVRERRFREAEDLFRRALSIAELRFGPLHPKTIRNVMNVGNCLMDQGMKVQAREFWMDAYQRMQKSTGNLLTLGESRLRANLITLLVQADDFEHAAPLAIDDLRHIGRLAEHMDDPKYYVVDPSRDPGPDPVDSTNGALDIAGHLMDKNDALAEAVFLACLPILKIMYGEHGLQIGLACNSLGILKKRKGALPEAEDYYRRALRAFAGTEKKEVAQAAHRNLLWVQRARLEAQTPQPMKRGELRLAKTIKAHDGAVLALAYSAQRKTLVSGGQDSLLKLWSTESLTMSHRLRGHKAPVSGLSVGKDGQFVVSGAWDQTIRIWNLAELAKEPIIQACPSDICGVAASPHGELRIVFVLEDGLVGLWDEPRHESAKAIGHHRDTATTVAISDDGKFAISGSRDQTVEFWDLAAAGSFSLSGHRQQITSVCVNHDGSLGISGSEDGAIIVWDLKNCEMLRILKGHTQIVGALAITSDDRWIVSGSWDKTICIWDAGSGERAATFAAGEQVWALAASPTFDPIYVGDKSGAIHLLQFIATGESTTN